MDISGKVGLITGGADGIGKVLVENLLKKGAKGVTIVDFNETKGQETCNEFQEIYGEGRVLFCKANVTSKEDLQGAFKNTIEKFGGLHIVCNNAGIANEVNWENMFRVNLNGTINGTLLAIEHMNDTDVGGVVVNMSSVTGKIKHEPVGAFVVTLKVPGRQEDQANNNFDWTGTNSETGMGSNRPGTHQTSCKQYEAKVLGSYSGRRKPHPILTDIRVNITTTVTRDICKNH
ncbi:15-hydroxyprostaglandin dehydrogenase [NAD(+)]-like [Amphiura filiformis]|uniref:15-hydroxyprostaglandin dehydrogenase [NAD(+)]-like n=1 Tax=Amphiura filiformis TaxID=82378 RepID=UPI003B20CFB5